MTLKRFVSPVESILTRT